MGRGVGGFAAPAGCSGQRGSVAAPANASPGRRRAGPGPRAREPRSPQVPAQPGQGDQLVGGFDDERDRDAAEPFRQGPAGRWPIREEEVDLAKGIAVVGEAAMGIRAEQVDDDRAGTNEFGTTCRNEQVARGRQAVVDVDLDADGMAADPEQGGGMDGCEHGSSRTSRPCGIRCAVPVRPGWEESSTADSERHLRG